MFSGRLGKTRRSGLFCWGVLAWQIARWVAAAPPTALKAAIGAAQPQEIVHQDAAFHERIELVFDELRQAGAGGLFSPGEEALGVLLHQAVQRGLLGSVALVVDRGAIAMRPAGLAGVGMHAMGMGSLGWCSAVILMPVDAPQAKMDATRGYGGEVIQFDRFKQDRVVLTREIAAPRGMTLIPPFDHADVIAGQGTAAKELFEEVGALDYLFVCMGGGLQQPFRSGSIARIDTPKTIADGAQTQAMGEITFAIMRRNVQNVLTATDAHLVEAMRYFA